jgi:hypothetical protein
MKYWMRTQNSVKDVRKMYRYHVIGTCNGTLMYAEITTNVVETKGNWWSSAMMLDTCGLYDWVLWMQFPTFNSLDDAMDFVKGRNGFTELTYDRLEVWYE